MSFPFTPSQNKKNIVSNNIPLPSSYVSRTESEVQLAMNVAAAEQRDERIFHRLINGIQDRHRQMKKKASHSTYSRPTLRTGRTDHEHTIDEDGNEYSNPLSAIANIVGTHHSEISDVTGAIFDSRRHRENDRYDEQAPSIQPTILKTCTGKNLSDSTLSDNDWSITGYEFSASETIEHKDIEDDDGNEDIFILDL